MKAAIYYAPNDIRVEDLPIPRLSEQPGLLLKVSACGLCGSDLRTFQFGHPRVTAPFILGHEISGAIVEIASQIQTDLKIGMRLAVAPLVFCGECAYCRQGRSQFCECYREIGQSWPGGFAEYMLIPDEALQHGVFHPIPDSLDAAHAAVAEPLSACLNAIDFVDFRAVRSAAIFGAGTIGCLLLQLLRLKGVQHITLIDPNHARLHVAGVFHPDATVNVTEIKTNLENALGGQRFDLVFTATAAPLVQNQALNISDKGGQIVVFSGLPRGHSEITVDYNQIHYRNLRIIGSSIYAKNHHARALELILKGKVQVEELVTRFPLVDFNQGLSKALSGEIIKAVFIP